MIVAARDQSAFKKVCSAAQKYYAAEEDRVPIEVFVLTRCKVHVWALSIVGKLVC